MTKAEPRHTAPMFERVALIGIGLIGSSISHAARRAGVVGSVVGSARTPATLETAMRLGLIDQGFITAAEAVEDADLVILCTPVGLCGPIAKDISRHLKPGAILTDVGSVKAAVEAGSEAAKRVGFRIVRTQFILYALVGLIAGIAGMVHCILSREADPFSIVGIELDVIAAVVLGGASIMGGRGTVIGTLLGVLLITIISSSLVLVGISSEWQRFVIGALIIIGTAIPVLQAKWNQRRPQVVQMQST